MNTTSNLSQLHELRLPGMATSYETLMTLPVQQLPTLHEAIAQLTQAELLYRTNMRTQQYLRMAGFRYKAAIEEISFSGSRSIDKNQLLALADCSYIQRSENILITGATGCGKSFIASALGYQGCIMGYKTLYFNMGKLVELIFQSKADNSTPKLLQRISRQKLLILDDFGIHPLENETKLALLQIMEDRHGMGATIITSQLPVGKWHDYFNEPTIADAIMDRLLAQEHRLELKGESLRRNKKMTANQPKLTE